MDRRGQGDPPRFALGGLGRSYVSGIGCYPIRSSLPLSAAVSSDVVLVSSQQDQQNSLSITARIARADDHNIDESVPAV